MAVLTDALLQALAAELGHKWHQVYYVNIGKVSLDCNSVELWSGKEKIQLDVVFFVVWVHKLSFTDENLRFDSIFEFQERHSGCLEYSVLILGENFWQECVTWFVVDLDLILNAYARSLAKTLDAVYNLSTQTHLLQLFGHFSVEHHGRKHTAGNCPLAAL